MAIDVTKLNPMELCALVQKELADQKKAKYDNRFKDAAERSDLSQAMNKADELLALLSKKESSRRTLLSRAHRLQKRNESQCQQIHKELCDSVSRIEDAIDAMTQAGEQIEFMKTFVEVPLSKDAVQAEEQVEPKKELVEDHPLKEPVVLPELPIPPSIPRPIEDQIAIAMITPIAKGMTAIPSMSVKKPAVVAINTVKPKKGISFPKFVML